MLKQLQQIFWLYLKLRHIVIRKEMLFITRKTCLKNLIEHF